MLLLEQPLVAVPHLHDRRHVHLVEGGEHGGGVLRFLEAARDGLAQLGHAHALLAGFGGGSVGARRGRGRWGGLRLRESDAGDRRGAAFDHREHVALGHAAFLARAGDGRRVDPLLLGDAADGRRQRIGVRRAGRGGLRRGRDANFGLRSGWSGRRLRFRRGRLLRRLWGRRRRRRRDLPFRDGAEDRAHRDGLPLLHGDLGDDARNRSVHLKRDFIGFKLGQRLVRFHGVASLLEPLPDRCFGDGLAKRGDDNFCGHA